MSFRRQVVQFLEARSPLKKTLDDIRSRGHYEHKETLRERSRTTPLRIERRCDTWPDVTDEHVALVRDTDERLGLNMPSEERPDKVNLTHWVKVARLGLERQLYARLAPNPTDALSETHAAAPGDDS